MKNVIGAFSKNIIEVFLWILIATCTLETGKDYVEKSVYKSVEIEREEFTESAQEIKNPNRGFYLMYGFIPSDIDEGFEEIVTERLRYDDRMLVMIQINLRNYTEGAISEQGLRNIEDIFATLRKIGKQYIVRVLYDWDGKNAETEPEDVEIILNHMRQLEGIFREYSDIIFVHQGLFIGNWGEMNGTKHLDSMQQLAKQLEAVTDEKTFLAVRMPMQWRIITEQEGVTDANLEANALVRRLSLFNDGIMGNAGDYGTYGVKSKSEVGVFSYWSREEELKFQEELCKYVPNGGEVIVENPVNDFENAVNDLAMMHLTYLNIDYDRNVLNKWAKNVVTEEGCFYGMDGLSYIERHLGYRLLIDSASIEYDFWGEILKLEVNIRNEGFAPMYKEPMVHIIISNPETGYRCTYPILTDLRTLVGGNDKIELYQITEEISLLEYEAGEYEVYLCLKDSDSGYLLELANEQEKQKDGYFIGSFTIEETPNVIHEVATEYWEKMLRDILDGK